MMTEKKIIAGQAEDQEHAAAVPRDCASVIARKNERGEQAEHQDHAEEPPLLGDRRRG